MLARAGGFVSNRGDRRANGRVEVKALPPPGVIDKIPPPHDLLAEETFISAMLVEHTARIADFADLRASEFFSGELGLTWSGILAVQAEGTPVDLVTVATWLRSNDKIRMIEGGIAKLTLLLNSAAPTTHPEAYYQTIKTCAKLRELGSVVQRINARVYVDHANPSDVFAEAERMVTDVVSTAGRGMRRIGIDEMLRPRPPEPPWLCKGLRLTAGRVTLIAGSPDSGKTLATQSLAISFASGRDAWGVFNVRRGRVVHLNWDQERDATERRYDKLLRGIGLTADDVRGYLELIDDPPISFDDEASFAELRAVARDAACIIIDALTGALGEVDENSPAVGRVLRRIGKISEQTGCVIIVIHHAGKPPATFKGKKPDRDAMFDIRGSSSIPGAAGAAFVQSPIKKGELYGVKMTRTPTVSKRALDPFALRFEDVEVEELVDGKRAEAVRVTYVDPQELASLMKSEKKGSDQDSAAAFDQVKSRVLELVKAAPGLSGADIKARLGRMSKDTVYAALRSLKTDGRVDFDKGPKRSELWRAI